MLKILQARLQQYVNWEIPDVQAEFRKVRGTRDQIANVHWIMEKTKEFQKNIYSCFIDYAKAFDCMDHNKLWKILKEMGIPDHPTCLLRNLYADQEATLRTLHGTTDWFKIVKRVGQGCILSFCLVNICNEESDMTERLPFHFSLSLIGEGNGNPLQCSCLENPRDRGAWWAAIYGVAQSQTRLKWLSSSRVYHAKCRLDEPQAKIKIARSNINNLRYADDTPLMAESKYEQKSL